MATFISHSPADTEALGETWGREATAGLVIGLSGDLGVGKTRLVKGIAVGLQSSARVHSPTFSLLNVYEGGRLTLCHLDLYRLDTPEQVVNAGLEPYFTSQGVTVVEWAERWFGDFSNPTKLRALESDLRPNTRLRWVIMETKGETERRISYEDLGH